MIEHRAHTTSCVLGFVILRPALFQATHDEASARYREEDHGLPPLVPRQVSIEESQVMLAAVPRAFVLASDWEHKYGNTPKSMGYEHVNCIHPRFTTKQARVALTVVNSCE